MTSITKTIPKKHSAATLAALGVLADDHCPERPVERQQGIVARLLAEQRPRLTLRSERQDFSFQVVGEVEGHLLAKRVFSQYFNYTIVIQQGVSIAILILSTIGWMNTPI